MAKKLSVIKLVLLGLPAAALVAFAILALQAWVLMLVLGALAATSGHSFAALSFWASFFLLWAAKILFQSNEAQAVARLRAAV